MLKNINYKNILHSIWIGILITILVYINLNKENNTTVSWMAILFGGTIGFVIGLVTEVLTAFLPKRIAGTALFFFISNLISVSVTALLLFILNIISTNNLNFKTFKTVISIAVPVIIIINIFEFIWYKRANIKLMHFQKSMDN